MRRYVRQRIRGYAKPLPDDVAEWAHYRGYGKKFRHQLYVGPVGRRKNVPLDKRQRRKLRRQRAERERRWSRFILEGGPTYVKIVVDGVVRDVRVNSASTVPSFVDAVRRATGKEPSVAPATQDEYKVWRQSHPAPVVITPVGAPASTSSAPARKGDPR